MRLKLLPTKLQLFEDPMTYIDAIKAMNWMHELLILYKGVLSEESLKDSFEMVCTIICRFAEYINKQKFVTMKQTEL
jgi:hypothetical protein